MHLLSTRSSSARDQFSRRVKSAFAVGRPAEQCRDHTYFALCIEMLDRGMRLIGGDRLGDEIVIASVSRDLRQMCDSDQLMMLSDLTHFASDDKSRPAADSRIDLVEYHSAYHVAVPDDMLEREHDPRDLSS